MKLCVCFSMNIWTISTCTFGKMRVFNVNSRSVNHAARNCGSVKKFGRASGFLAGPVDFQIHWPCGPVVSTVQCQGLLLLAVYIGPQVQM